MRLEQPLYYAWWTGLNFRARHHPALAVLD